MPVLQQFALAVFLGLTTRHLGLCCCNLGFGYFQVLAVLLGVEAGKEIALFYFCPDIDRPFEDLAIDPKADISLVARLDLASKRYPLPAFLEFYSDGTHRPDDRCRGLFFFVTSRQKQ